MVFLKKWRENREREVIQNPKLLAVEAINFQEVSQFLNGKDQFINANWESISHLIIHILMKVEI